MFDNIPEEKIPTNDELVSFIDKFIEFVKEIVAFFAELGEGLKMEFPPYKRQY